MIRKQFLPRTRSIVRIRQPFRGKTLKRVRISRRHPTVSIVGPGRVGQALGKLLARAGVPVGYIAARRLAAAQRAVRFIGTGQAVGLGTPEFARSSVILMTVSDSAISEVTRRLVRLCRDWREKVVLHTCGALPASVLRPLRQRGAAIGSLHPFQTIPNVAAGVRSLRGCFWGIEGDAAARKLSLQWVHMLAGIPFPVRASRKTLYHAAAFLACPALLTLLDCSARLLRRAGVPASTIRPMLRGFVVQTAGNFATLGARRALTGPVVRGDWKTIRDHLRALRRFAPEALPAYSALLRQMVRLVGARIPRRFLQE
jgi:predicted short-subunit dehydrogenase-like oxidoreductase (DUF2520 family)